VVILALAAMVFGAMTAASAEQTKDPNAEKAYVLGPGDQLSVQVIDVDEFTGKTVKIDDPGGIVLPLVGRIDAAGLTVPELTTSITSKLSKYVVKPEVTVTIAEKRTQPVTVSGAVKSPGVLSITPGKTLFEVLAMAGGILPEAGYRVRITRRASFGTIPVTGVQSDASGQNYVADIPLKGLEEGDSADNIPILPNDFIAVPRAELIYVLGDVKRAGAFALADGQTVSVLQALGMAEGTLTTAAPSKASIKRRAGEDKVVDIPVDIDKIMKGKLPDQKLQAKDILVVPGSASHGALQQTISTILAIGTGVVIRLY